MKKEQVFKEMKDELVNNKTFEKKAIFKCFADGIFTYQIKSDTFIVEINIIADDMFFAKEKPKDLFDKKRIGYFDQKIYDLNNNYIGGKVYRPLGECEIN
jgi:hypothetical protein